MIQEKMPLFVKRALEQFGVQAGDCTFEKLRECAKFLKAGETDESTHRWHDPIIEEMVRPAESLLDLGCGDGELLALLTSRKRCWVQGVECNEDAVNRCIERGLPVCHADLEDILPCLPTQSYDWAVLENTMFTLQRPVDVLLEMLRVANKIVVTFPNFAHWSVRFTFGLGGRMPVTKALPYKWYDTPNIHLCSITDFQDFIQEHNLTVLQSWVLVDGEIIPFDQTKDHNITGEQALFVLQNPR